MYIAHHFHSVSCYSKINIVFLYVSKKYQDSIIKKTCMLTSYYFNLPADSLQFKLCPVPLGGEPWSAVAAAAGSEITAADPRVEGHARDIISGDVHQSGFERGTSPQSRVCWRRPHSAAGCSLLGIQSA